MSSWTEEKSVRNSRCSSLAYHPSYCLSIITHSIRSLNTNTSIKHTNGTTAEECGFKKGNAPFYLTYFSNSEFKGVQGVPLKPSVRNVDFHLFFYLRLRRPVTYFLFFKFTTVGWKADTQIRCRWMLNWTGMPGLFVLPPAAQRERQAD